MKITMYGTRGSLPTPSSAWRQTHEFGGNTTNVLVEGDDGSLHIIDAGSGIKTLSEHLIANHGFDKGAEANLYLTHTHWDHIQGFPFFGAAYNPNNKITLFGEAKVEVLGQGIHGLKSEEDLESTLRQHPEPFNVLSINGDGVREVLAKQQDFRNFPVPTEIMKAVDYVDFLPGTGPIYDSGTMRVETLPVNHPGGCVSYKFTEIKPDGSEISFVFSGDFEPRPEDHQKTVDWWSRSSLVIADSQYDAPGEDNGNPFMEGYGHSNYKANIDFARYANVKRLVLTHHEPKMDDNYHLALEERAQELAEKVDTGMRVRLAREGDVYVL